MIDNNLTSKRKKDHLSICIQNQVEAGSTLFDDIHLVHSALPECNMDDIDTSVNFLGNNLKSPLFISSMTGGHPDTIHINKVLAEVSELYGIGMGVGSQRAALENPELIDSFSVVRDVAPHAYICGNIGVVQLVEHGIEWADKAIEMIDANALCVHLNFLQESLQSEGDHSAVGCLNAIKDLCHDVKYPIIVKETGSGISERTASKLWEAGVSAIDVGGYGGTSWSKIEGFRSSKSTDTCDKILSNLSGWFNTWGIPTAVSVFEVSKGNKGPVIATGGIRSGIDIAKSISIGADMGGMALPLLKPALSGIDATCKFIDLIHLQLRISMFLTGSKTISDLKHAQKYITGTLSEIIK